jgi:hypothetical protein
LYAVYPATVSMSWIGPNSALKATLPSVTATRFARDAAVGKLEE